VQNSMFLCSRLFKNEELSEAAMCPIGTAGRDREDGLHQLHPADCYLCRPLLRSWIRSFWFCGKNRPDPVIPVVVEAFSFWTARMAMEEPDLLEVPTYEAILIPAEVTV